MSDLFTEIIKNSTNNKNVSTLIVEYLTDLPILPFLDELIEYMILISTDSDWNYENYYIKSYSGTRVMNKTYIHLIETHALFKIR